VNSVGAEGILWKVQESNVPGEPSGEEFLADLKRRGLDEREQAVAARHFVRTHLWYFATTRVAWDVTRFAALPRDWWIVTGRVAPHAHGFTYWLAVAALQATFYLAFVYRLYRASRGQESRPRSFVVLLYATYWAQYAMLWGDPRFAVPVYPILVSFLLPLGRTRETEPNGVACLTPAHPQRLFHA
jgi:hypothetical protein